MSSKIEWYEEVLALEPGSKVFFPLARLFVDTGQHDKAVATLRKGLDRHPDFIEARLLLIQLLVEQGDKEDAGPMLDHIIEPLRQSPAFWNLWAAEVAEENRDFAVFLMLVASHLSGRPVQWADVVMEGVNSLADRLVGPAAPRETSAPVRGPAVRQEQSAAQAMPDYAPEADGELDDEEAVAAPRGPSYRTLTMASVLAAQGDRDGALEICTELLEAEQDPARRAEIKARMATISGEEVVTEAECEDVFSKHAKNRLIGALETLAARFEARVAAAEN